MRLVTVLFIAVFMPLTAYAAPCTNPSGDEGDQVYNTTYHVMQYCNGSHWVAMGSIAGQGDNLGNHMAERALDMSDFKLQNLADPTAPLDGANKQYTDTKVDKSGDAMTGFLTLSGAPTAMYHAATKEYVDTVLASGSGGSDGKVCYTSLPVCAQNCGGGGPYTYASPFCAGDFQQYTQFPCNAGPIQRDGIGFFGHISTDCRVCCMGMEDYFSPDCLSGASGAICDDGAVFIGVVAGNRIYAAPVDEAAEYQSKTMNTATTGTGSTTDGRANTNAMIAAGAALHPAAQQCRSKGADWYLPATEELAMIVQFANLDRTGRWYASSSDWSSSFPQYVYALRFDTFQATSGTKTNPYKVRCVRR